MEKETKKSEELKPTQPTPVLSPEIESAIRSEIQKSIGAAIREALKQSEPAKAMTQAAAAQQVPQQAPYKTKLQGIPVEPGQDLRHVHPDVIRTWFANIENRWKEQYKRNSSMQSSLSLSQGAPLRIPT